MSNEADEIFFRAREISNPEERSAYLQKACLQNADLLAYVENLLANHEMSESYFAEIGEENSDDTDTLLSESSPTLVDESTISEDAGAQIGRYKLLEKIGEGGFGSVWAAEQKEPVRRRVALKIIKLGMDTKQVVARFEAERQALALMDHPNIARVLDAGATESGRPYFVMELVKGTAITKYCAEEQLGVETRLKLFTTVCQAIQHAHQKGIIHRDIKPSNIMVTLHDGVPVPKVIDFGIAKATQQELTEKTIYTQYSQFIGTPAYMSPEQAEMSGLDIDTRSDIYSLGVLLYELLTGRTPFDAKELMRSGLDEMRRIIREREPVRPSSKLSQTLASADITPVKERNPKTEKEIAWSRRQLQELKGDLDWIVMKCLEKDRSRRYETANGLAADLKRYLRNDPVTAVAPSVGYRVTKFVQRNRKTVTGALAIAVFLMATTTTTTLMWLSATQAKNNESVQRQLAQEALEGTRSTLERMQIQKAEELFGDGQWSQGIGYLGRVLRVNPSNRVAASRLSSVMVERVSVAVPLTEPLRHNGSVMSAKFSPDGKHVVTAANDNSAQIWSVTTGHPVGAALTHDDAVVWAEFSPDGTLVATASNDNTARVWDANTGEPLTDPLPHDDLVISARFDPVGQRIVTASHDKTARIWDATSGKPVTEPMRHEDVVKSALFSPDGDKVVTSSDDNTARVWDSSTGQQLVEPIVHSARLYSAEFSPDGDRILTACNDKTARIWNANTGRPASAPLRHASKVKSARFSPDGRRVVTASDDDSARVWDASTGSPITEPLRHGYEVVSAVFSPDGQMVATASHDKTARVWDASTGKLLFEPIRHGSLVWSAQFTPDSHTLVTASQDRTARLWNVNSGQPIPLTLHHSHDVNSALFSPDGERLLTASDDTAAQLWDTNTGQPLGKPLEHEHWVISAEFNPDGTKVVSASYDKTARIWDANTSQLLAGPLTHTATVKHAEFSPDGQRVVTASYDQTARVWDAKTGQAITSPLHHEGQVIPAKFSSDSLRVVTGSEDQTARVWDAITGKPLTSPMRHEGKVKSVEFSPDGKQVLTASGVLQRAGETLLGAARIWDAETGKPLTDPFLHEDQVKTARFSPDGQKVVTASEDNTARIWDAKTGLPLTEPMRHEGKLYMASFSSDGTLVVTASWDKTARVWDAQTGLAITGPLRHEDNVYSAQFSPDGQRIATASYDNTARIWDVFTAPTPVPPWFLDWVGARIGRQLTRTGLGEPIQYTELRKQQEFVSSLSNDDFYARIAQWIQSDAGTRTISPHSPLTVPEYAANSITEKAHEIPN